jgi:CubicO group peptidase (beta-lactamase class C family)
MTKPVFAYAVHQLVKSHQLDLDTPLYRYYPYDDIDYDDRYKLITARMVLSHTTGFPNWRNGGELRIMSDPGTKYGYSGEGFEYLSLVVKHLLNKKIQHVVEQEVFRPLSINNSFLIKNPYVMDHLADGLKDNKEWGVEGRRYSGLIDLPDQKAVVALVVLVPGSGKTNVVAGNWFHDIRSHFSEQGIACLVWDKTGCGKSEGVFNYNH